MATVTAMPNVKIAGGSFLIEERKPEEVFTPEDFTEQHLLIARTAEEFAIKEIVPNIEKLEHKDFALLRELVRVQLIIRPPPPNQLSVCALLGDLPILDHQNPIGAANRAQAMGDHE